MLKHYTMVVPHDVLAQLEQSLREFCTFTACDDKGTKSFDVVSCQQSLTPHQCNLLELVRTTNFIGQSCTDANGCPVLEVAPC